MFDDITHLTDYVFKIIKTKMKDYTMFTLVMDLMDDTETFLEEMKPYIDAYTEKKAAEIKDYEEKLSGMMERITHLEDEL